MCALVRRVALMQSLPLFRTTNPNARRNEYIQSLELLLDYDGFESLALPPRVRGVSNDAMLAIFVLQSPSSPSISVFLTPD
jgi:hypothetical protein